MDPKQLEELIRKIIGQEVVTPWWIYLSLILLSGCIGFFIAYLSEYAKSRGRNLATKKDFEQILNQTRKTAEATEQIKLSMATDLSKAVEKGKNIATKEDFDELLVQVSKTTETTKQIEAKISQASWVGQSELEYRKEQLKEFYGPIYARLKLSGELYRLWMDNKLKGVNKGIIDTFQRQNEEIKNIIATKAHLIDDDQIPEVFTRFMTSTTIWNWYTARPDHPWVDQDVASLPESKWPKDFETYIFSTTEELKTKLAELYRKYVYT